MSYTPANATTALEDALQARVAESEQWLLAATDNGRQDTSSRLAALGFEVREKTGLFYKVNPPVGFTKKTEGYWTYVTDGNGAEIITQFYKAAPWDTDAFLNFR